MIVPALMYHDVTPRGYEDASGFTGGDAARYKLAPERFDRHLAAIASRVSIPPVFTFDDGGASAMTIADALELHGWRGYFFVTTRYVNQAGFVDAAAIRALHARGHVIGSHSHTHPLRMAQCPEDRLIDEWRRSVTILADVVGHAVTAASVPGGHFSPAVGSAASAAGIDLLFTSKPTLEEVRIGSTRIRGRFPILASTRASTAAALAVGDPVARARWSAVWCSKVLAKRAFGTAYLRVRGRLLGASPDVQWGDEMTSASEDPS